LFNTILFWLLLSLLFTVIAPGLAYFSQIAYQSAIEKEEYHWDRPFIRPTRRSTAFGLIGDGCRWAAVLAVLAAIGCLIIGGIRFLQLVGS
jgi:hypothetical protein